MLERNIELRIKHLCFQLKDPYRDVAFDYFCKQQTIPEIATQTGQNVKTLQTRLYRAKSMLRTLWKEEFT